MKEHPLVVLRHPVEEHGLEAEERSCMLGAGRLRVRLSEVS